ncbi:hypothetical protein HDU98_005531 [Podochytrium sp. JEL0797]|nr:hypothetical protein HDU98_005531 [Podochytrium sp. JEL0797]
MHRLRCIHVEEVGASMPYATAAELAGAIRDLESSPCLGLKKDAAIHLLMICRNSLSDDQLSAVKRTANNPAERPYIRSSALVILGHVDARKAILVKRCEKAMLMFESMTPAELHERVNADSITIREYLSTPLGWVGLAKERIGKATECEPCEPSEMAMRI